MLITSRWSAKLPSLLGSSAHSIAGTTMSVLPWQPKIRRA